MTSKKISPANKTRIYTMHVDRNTQVNHINRVNPIHKTNRITNHSFHSSDNYLLGTSNFYDNLRKLKEQYLSFYKVEKELEDALKAFDHREDHHLTIIIENLIDKYNHAIHSLKEFDHYFGTNHCKNIYDILLLYKSLMEKIGIMLDKNYALSFEKKNFQKAVQENSRAIDFLFNTKNGLIRKLYHAFRDIQVPSKQGGYHEYGLESSSIIDKKY
ncbi:hypothetical protein [Thermotalea metallivorans]|uniref:Uncharacterized protein n=1 Tax=Thermotalea metallivorans TaxID=520762 RepID=A0A140L1B4_9FIRM|nr:hypothetical protein [Thermotalea metallivorans]KXG74339.1 hypothetical protein AN619_24320 [Thermotalea metallivorans]